MRSTHSAFVLGLALLALAVRAEAHPGHDHPPGLRVWKDAERLFEIEASFVTARRDEVQLRKHDGTLVSVPLARLSQPDREWVRQRRDDIAALNHSGSPSPGEFDAERRKGSFLIPLVTAGALVLLAAGAVALKRSRVVLLPGVFVLVSACSAAALPEEEEASDEGTPPVIRKHFKPFEGKLAIRWNDDYLYVGSDGLPEHRMMVGIKAWQQQVPLPQPYTGKNAWRIPLKPVLAKKPISAKKALFRGAIALAINGVPIFNALNNRGEDAFLAGELDEFGGHCGRGDDYHYHTAPVHLQKAAGKGNPIAYALDGFPLYGYADADGKEPEDLDEYNGRIEGGEYRYYSTRKYPYINGGMRGVVTVRGDQIEPQPKDAPVRPAGRPLRGAKITDFTRDKNAFTLKYDLRGATHTIEYTIDKEGKCDFAFTDGGGKGRKETYRRRGKGGRPPKKDDRE
jgi:hypothetical protein